MLASMKTMSDKELLNLVHIMDEHDFGPNMTNLPCEHNHHQNNNGNNPPGVRQPAEGNNTGTPPSPLRTRTEDFPPLPVEQSGLPSKKYWIR
jgi:hypothetical protein